MNCRSNSAEFDQPAHVSLLATGATKVIGLWQFGEAGIRHCHRPQLVSATPQLGRRHCGGRESVLYGCRRDLHRTEVAVRSQMSALCISTTPFLPVFYVSDKHQISLALLKRMPTGASLGVRCILTSSSIQGRLLTLTGFGRAPLRGPWSFSAGPGSDCPRDNIVAGPLPNS